MTYEYKVTPAPRRPKRMKGMKSAEAFAATLAEAINVAAREGWEYVRAESLPAIEGGGWFRRPSETVETVLIFRRPRESAEPRLAAARVEAGLDEAPPGPRLGAVDRPVPASAAPLRREPRVAEPAVQPATGPAVATPLRPPPRLGPAD
ncbi:DUF4177 domain-containing protein [Amaricoccus sp.]|uniref:DUF4177 domain-containing protein n=1 Tax=Amaricoccus sp. TaxID=1872485 RepID=UPI001B74DA9D|nr:DUF4177 domain-containing protein [Amaricoccus sp.]MBP7002101.1 DUF4177 domain-containing protein [Amaricoccus sp.]